MAQKLPSFYSMAEGGCLHYFFFARLLSIHLVFHIPALRCPIWVFKIGEIYIKFCLRGIIHFFYLCCQAVNLDFWSGAMHTPSCNIYMIKIDGISFALFLKLPIFSFCLCFLKLIYLSYACRCRAGQSSEEWKAMKYPKSPEANHLSLVLVSIQSFLCASIYQAAVFIVLIAYEDIMYVVQHW